jgi:hypothetical protein
VLEGAAFNNNESGISKLVRVSVIMHRGINRFFFKEQEKA